MKSWTPDRTQSGRLLIVAFVLLSAATLVQGYVNSQADERRAAQLEERLDNERAEKDLLARRINESRAQTTDLIEQVQRLGQRPVVTPGELPPATVPATGSITAADIEVAVGDYFQRFPIRVPQVSTATIQAAVAGYLTTNPPSPGRPPTDREIAEQVAAYLTANPPPRGEKGEAGGDGPAGADGTDGAAGANGQPGREGRSIVAAQLDGCDLVLDFSDGTSRRLGPVCGPAGPPGPAGAEGPMGPEGPVGAAGRGIASTSCDEASERFVVTYTDGTSESVAGSDCVAGGGPAVEVP